MSYPACPENTPTRCRFQESGQSVTSVYFPPTYDRDGVNHNPDRNAKSADLQCTVCGRRWRGSGVGFDPMVWTEIPEHDTGRDDAVKDYIDMSAAEIANEARLAASPGMHSAGGAASVALALIEALASRVADLTDGTQPITLGPDSIERIAVLITNRLSRALPSQDETT